MRILVVDDDEPNRTVLKAILSGHGHDVVERANGLEALEALWGETFDAVISDVLMPGMDGYRLCSEVRRNERLKDMPILVVSSLYATSADEAVALRAGADRFLSRPVSVDALLDALAQACGASRPPASPSPEERDGLREYSEYLVTKLKEKSLALEEARRRLVERNEDLRRTNAALEKDVSESRRQEEKAEQLALHDSLTGLPNRVLFDDRLAMALRQARRHQKRLAIFFMDLDDFKAVNDSLGHPAGDELLHEVADRLRTIVREEDTLARFGGDEFILLVTGVASERDLTTVSNKILEKIRAPFEIGGRTLPITVSVGVAAFPADGQSPEALVRNADIAMYRAKRNGRNTYRVFAPEGGGSSPSHLNLEAQLRNALRSGEFFLHYQPVVELSRGRIQGLEALLRWRAADGTMISPSTFIPVAESSDLILPLSRWVLRSACAQFSSWAAGSQASVTIAVNLSARVFQQTDLVEEVSVALEEADLPPACLDLEITESIAMQNVEYSAAQLRRLKDLGVHISLDDFGTGYSSLSYLKKLPIDRIKIDRSFVRNVANDPDDAAIVSAVIAMTHRLKRTAVAEGVETAPQLGFLRREACDQGQGFLFSEPLAPPAAERSLRSSAGQASPYRHHFEA